MNRREAIAALAVGVVARKLPVDPPGVPHVIDGRTIYLRIARKLPPTVAYYAYCDTDAHLAAHYDFLRRLKGLPEAVSHGDYVVKANE